MEYSEAANANYERLLQAKPPTSEGLLTEAAMSFVFERAWNAPGLSWREKRLVAITCAAANAQADPLAIHLAAAVKSGDFTPEELESVSLVIAAYHGFPTAHMVIGEIRKLAPAQPSPAGGGSSTPDGG